MFPPSKRTKKNLLNSAIIGTLAGLGISLFGRGSKSPQQEVVRDNPLIKVESAGHQDILARDFEGSYKPTFLALKADYFTEPGKRGEDNTWDVLAIVSRIVYPEIDEQLKERAEHYAHEENPSYHAAIDLFKTRTEGVMVFYSPKFAEETKRNPQLEKKLAEYTVVPLNTHIMTSSLERALTEGTLEAFLPFEHFEHAANSGLILKYVNPKYEVFWKRYQEKAKEKE